MSKQKIVFHHGDVVGFKLENDTVDLAGYTEIPVVLPNRITAQEGEASGHFHNFVDPTAIKLYQSPIKDGVRKMILVVLKPTALVHENRDQTLTQDHRTLNFVASPQAGSEVELPLGTYALNTVREWRDGLARPVLD